MRWPWSEFTALPGLSIHRDPPYAVVEWRKCWGVVVHIHIKTVEAGGREATEYPWGFGLPMHEVVTGRSGGFKVRTPMEGDRTHIELRAIKQRWRRRDIAVHRIIITPDPTPSQVAA